MLPNFKDHVKKLEKCIEENQNFLFNIVSHTNEMFENRDHTKIPSVSYDHKYLVPLLFEKGLKGRGGGGGEIKMFIHATIFSILLSILFCFPATIPFRQCRICQNSPPSPESIAVSYLIEYSPTFFEFAPTLC